MRYWDAFEWLLAIIMTLIVVMIGAVIFVAATDDTPSCEDRGGKTTFSHFLPIFNGKTTSLIPQYTCKVPK